MREPTEMETKVWRAMSMEEFYSVDEGDDGIPRGLKVARAAIRAMREPTREQEIVMNKLLGPDTPPTRRWGWVWESMIDAASPPDA